MSLTLPADVRALIDGRKVRNLRRDPGVSVSVTDAADPYRHTQLRERVVLRLHVDRIAGNVK